MGIAEICAEEKMAEEVQADSAWFSEKMLKPMRESAEKMLNL